MQPSSTKSAIGSRKLFGILGRFLFSLVSLKLFWRVCFISSGPGYAVTIGKEIRCKEKGPEYSDVILDLEGLRLCVEVNDARHSDTARRYT